MLYRTIIGTAAVLAVAAPAGAQPAREAQRRALLQQAAEARRANDHERALDLARQAAALGPAPAVQLFIAEELVALARPDEAFEAAQRCASDAESARGPGSARVADRCRTLAGEIDGGTGRVVVRVSSPPPRLHVWVGDRDVPRESWRNGVRVAPGRVVVEATAPGHRTLRRTVSVAAGEATDVTLALDAEGAAGSAAPDPGATGATPAARDGEADRGSGGAGAWPWVVLGVGVASLGAAAAFRFVLYADAVDQRDALCPGGRCTSPETYVASLPHVEDAGTWSLASNLALGVGATAVATGILWAIVGRPRSATPASRAASLHVSPAPGGAAITLGGAL